MLGTWAPQPAAMPAAPGAGVNLQAAGNGFQAIFDEEVRFAPSLPFCPTQ